MRCESAVRRLVQAKVVAMCLIPVGEVPLDGPVFRILLAGGKRADPFAFDPDHL